MHNHRFTTAFEFETDEPFNVRRYGWRCVGCGRALGNNFGKHYITSSDRAASRCSKCDAPLIEAAWGRVT